MTRQSVYTIETVEQPILGSIPLHPLNRLSGGCHHYCFSLDTILNQQGWGHPLGSNLNLGAKFAVIAFPLTVLLQAVSTRQELVGL